MISFQPYRGVNDQRGKGGLELNERASWVGHDLTGESHAATLTISVNQSSTAGVFEV